VPIVCLQHFTGTLDNWDPIIINGLARERQVITIDNTGIGNSGGETPDNVQDMSKDAMKTAPDYVLRMTFFNYKNKK